MSGLSGSSPIIGSSAYCVGLETALDLAACLRGSSATALLSESFPADTRSNKLALPPIGRFTLSPWASSTFVGGSAC